MRMLLLEDDERVARGILRITTTLGHEAVHARKVEEAKNALRTRSFAVIFADLGLAEGESGIDLLRWARGAFPEVRRVLTSGAVRPRDFEIQPPMQLFLPKPFGRTELALVLGGATVEPHDNRSSGVK